MRFVDVEAAHAASSASSSASIRATQHDDHGTAATETSVSAAETAAKAAAEDLNVGCAAIQTDSAAATALLLQLIAQFGDTCLHLTRIECVLFRSSHGAGNSYRLIAALRRQAVVAQARAGERCGIVSLGHPRSITVSPAPT